MSYNPLTMRYVDDGGKLDLSMGAATCDKCRRGYIAPGVREEYARICLWCLYKTQVTGFSSLRSFLESYYR